MIRPLVYVETTIPSFYHEERTAPDIVARREWTRHWWNRAAKTHRLVVSEPVLEELGRGRQDPSKARLLLVEDLPILPVEEPILEIVETYIRHKVMPADPGGDALHLALASYHKCDFLVTWNCRHLANANKFGHIRRVNTLLGLYVPTLATPLEMLGEEDDDEAAT